MDAPDKEIPMYYNFDYLLRAPPRMTVEEQNALMDEFLSDEDKRKELYVDLAMNTFAIHGDTMYDKDASFASQVPTESIMDVTKAAMMKTPTVKILIMSINDKIAPIPQAKLNYFRLLDFEMFLLRQKRHRRLTRKNKSV
jgi:hypothetical protein